MTLRPKAFDLLAELIRAKGQVISRDELLQRVWPDTTVTANVLDQTLRDVRKALGDTPGSPKFIETVPKKGYRFIAEVEAVPHGRIRSTRSGHRTQTSITSLLYASLFSLSVAVELSFEYDSFRKEIFIYSPIVFIWVFSTTWWALDFLFSANRFHRRIVVACTILLAGACTTVLALMPSLPDRPIVVANIQTYTVQAAYLKNATYYLATAFGLILPSFLLVEFVETGKLKSMGLTLLACGLMLAEFSLFLYFGLTGVSHLMDNLRITKFSSLFQILVRLLLLLYFCLGIELLAWCWYSIILTRETDELSSPAC